MIRQSCEDTAVTKAAMKARSSAPSLGDRVSVAPTIDPLDQSVQNPVRMVKDMI